MTIAIGFPCEDGIVLCADTQMTCRVSGMKYSDAKMGTMTFMGRGNTWTVGIAYAGDEGVFKNFFGAVREALENEAKPERLAAIDKKFIINTIRGALEEAHAQSPDINSEFIDVICGVAVNGKTSMYMGKRTVFYEEHEPAYIGVGNRSLSRFLAAALPLAKTPLSARQALVAGVYIVNQAKEFVDGCGNETQAVLVKNDGFPDIWAKGNLSIEKYLVPIAEHMQRSVKELFEVLISSAKEKDGLEREIKNAREKISAFYDYL